jgi:hypothetical protein
MRYENKSDWRKKSYTGWGGIIRFSRNDLFIAIYVCRMTFASFHLGKEEFFSLSYLSSELLRGCKFK